MELTQVIINGVDFTGAKEKNGHTIPLWRATVGFDSSSATLRALSQLASRDSLFHAVWDEDAETVWAIDAPFGLPKTLLRDPGFNLTCPLWSRDNFAVFEEAHTSIPASGAKRKTDLLCPGTAGPWTVQLKNMTYQAIALLNAIAVAAAPEPDVSPWAPRGASLRSSRARQ